MSIGRALRITRRYGIYYLSTGSFADDVGFGRESWRLIRSSVLFTNENVEEFTAYLLVRIETFGRQGGLVSITWGTANSQNAMALEEMPTHHCANIFSQVMHGILLAGSKSWENSRLSSLPETKPPHPSACPIPTRLPEPVLQRDSPRCGDGMVAAEKGLAGPETLGSRPARMCDRGL